MGFEGRTARQAGAVDYSAGLTVRRSTDRGYDWLPRDLKRRVKRGDQINLDPSGNVVGVIARQEPMNAVRQREAISHEPQGRVDYRAARSAAVATEQMPIWLQRILGLETTQLERGGVSYPIIDATGIYPSVDKLRRGLNGQSGRALALFHKAIERRSAVGISPGFQQEVIEHPLSGVPPIVAVQDRDPNPNARVRAFYSVFDGGYILRAISGVDRRDERTALDVFKTEGYRTDNHRSSGSKSARE